MIIIKVPGINGLNKTNNCRDSGNAIIAELKTISSNERGQEIHPEALELEEIHVNNTDLDEQEKLIYKNSLEILKEQEKIIFIGGDHSISYPIGQAFLDNSKKQKTKKEPCLIVFDAHPDCMPEMKNPTHEEWLRALINYRFHPENILLIGVRKSDQKETQFLKEKKIKQISINQLNNNIEDTTDTITEFANNRPLYVSFDIDIIDPAFAPSTNHPEPGGLTSRQALYIIQRLSLVKTLKAFDLVEVDLEKDKKINNTTIKLASKILAELI